MTDQSLVDLVAGCRRKQQSAMKAFYERFYGYALSVCLAYADNPDDARELVNDGFLKVFSRLDELRSLDGLTPWLRRIMVNTAIDHYRKQLKRPTAVSAEAVSHRLEEPYLNDEAIFAQLSAEHILAVLHQLAVPYRLVFSLYVLEGYSHREIGERLTITESTSRSHLTEANRLLRKLLATQVNQSHERAKR
ncbi:sigma-70 family RNA polymerase sigma factor [Nibrella viscosa]|uniref:Sigma-70 family RNA polymerase sigma factor n=1 Tax=Nibrella viscosa TaxID=1084524 RepID=A0ABP8JUL1_9BACT